MNTDVNSTFLKEMGITEWSVRNAPESDVIAQTPVADEVVEKASSQRKSLGTWWFFGNKPQGDSEILFQNIIRALGLMASEWSWKSPSEKMDHMSAPQDGSPIVAIAFGGSAAQKLSGERDSLSELRETVLAINSPGLEEIPLIATFELNQLISRPNDKPLFWQDLLLAKSVLQNI